jgi:tetratricopeptide (TPR) repeat protein
MERYDEALMDLDKALTLKSNYLNALMNRADVYNYHKVDKEKALVDYNKIIELQGEGGRAVCSHMVDAKYPKFSLAKVLAIPSMIMGCGK